MTTHEQPVFVGYSLLGYSGQAALLIVESKHHENQRKPTHKSSSYQNRVLEVPRLMGTSLPANSRRRLQSLRYLDELERRTRTNRRRVRRTHTAQGHRRGNSLHTNALTPAAYALKGGQTPFFTSPCVEMFLFPFHMPHASITYIFHL